LTGLGHDVATATHLGLAASPDEVLLQAARQQSRILVIRDRDFGNLVFVQNLDGGLIYLRLLPATLAAVHFELERVLLTYSEPELLIAFDAVEPGRHRSRRLMP
jgi:predicted nuclease of predicted toxin-antitoxin system